MANSSNIATGRHRDEKIALEPVEEVRVWDSFVRVFHWTLVVAIVMAYVTGDEWMLPHVWAGYLAGVLVVLRVIWGFIGPRHARFSSFVYRPRKVIRYARDLIWLGGRRYIGHSPAGGAMVVVLLAMILLVTATGLLALAVSESAGPLAGYVPVDRTAARLWKTAHEILANATLALVLVHVSGVLWASLVHGENLIRAMWTGKKKARLHDNG